MPQTYYEQEYGPEGFQGKAGYQEHSENLLTNILPKLTGMTQWMQGGQYDPRGRWTMDLANAMVGDPAQVRQTMQAPSAFEAQRYGQAAMDLASRSASQQAGFAAVVTGTTASPIVPGAAAWADNFPFTAVTKLHTAAGTGQVLGFHWSTSCLASCRPAF